MNPPTLSMFQNLFRGPDLILLVLLLLAIIVLTRVGRGNGPRSK